VSFFVVIGEIAIVHPDGSAEFLVHVYDAGQFTGEVGPLLGRRNSYAYVSQSQGSDWTGSLTYVGFGVDRCWARHYPNARFQFTPSWVGGGCYGIFCAYWINKLRKCASNQRIPLRSGYPYTYIELERDPDVENLLDSFYITASKIPI